MPTRSNHPSDSKEAEEMFMKIAKAHEALTDQVYPHKRGHLLAFGVWCEHRHQSAILSVAFTITPTMPLVA